MGSVVWTDSRATERDHLITWTEKEKRPTGKRPAPKAELDAKAAEMREKYARTKHDLPPWVRKLLQRHAVDAGVPVREMLGSNRTQEVVAARVAASVDLRKHRLSLPTIGKYLGGKDHTTVLHYLRLAEKRAQPIGEIPCPDLSGEWAI